VTSGIKLSELFTEILDNPARYSVIYGLLCNFLQEKKASFFETQQKLERHIAAAVQKGKKLKVTRTETVYVGKMAALQKLVLNELNNLVVALRRRHWECDDPEFEEITLMLCDMTKNLLAPLGEKIPEVIPWRSRYDLVRWRRDDYQKPLSHYSVEKPIEFHLVMNNFAQTRMTNSVLSKMDDDNMKIQYYLRNTNSSNVRRQIVYASETMRKAEMHLLNLEGFADGAQSAQPGDIY
jgi:hypothetical protein